MTYLPHLHTDEQTRQWINEVMIPQARLWVAERHGRVVGFAAPGWTICTYTPEWQGTGVGTALLDQAKMGRPSLDLHLFQRNEGARRLYELHGFTPVSVGDGSDNEESLPDAHLRWVTARQPIRATGLNASLTCAFPDALAEDVRAVTDLLPHALHPPTAAFEAVVGEDRLTIPERIHHPEITSEGSRLASRRSCTACSLAITKVSSGSATFGRSSPAPSRGSCSTS